MRTMLVMLCLSLLILLVRCRHEIPLPGNAGGQPDISNTCSPDSVYFANSVLPLINGACAISGCHDPVTHKEDLVLNSYRGIISIVRPGNAAESKLYRVITTTNTGDVMPPPPHSRLSSDDIAAIRKWINQGAKNNQCIAPCDTNSFTYRGAVTAIINTYCKGCHNPASLGGGIDLSTYNYVKAIATTGRLVGSIRHLPGYVPMPQGTIKLQDCQIRQIERWIESGMPDN